MIACKSASIISCLLTGLTEGWQEGSQTILHAWNQAGCPAVVQAIHHDDKNAFMQAGMTSI
jgi:hypothetical protein